jgi:hypothetical protein
MYIPRTKVSRIKIFLVRMVGQPKLALAPSTTPMMPNDAFKAVFPAYYYYCNSRFVKLTNAKQLPIYVFLKTRSKIIDP